MSKTESNILLLSITLSWSASYIFIKNLPADFSSYAYLTMTAGIAAVLMMLLFWRKLLLLNRKVCIQAFYMAGLLTLNLLTEKWGIEFLPASNASFLSSLSIIMVPLLLLIFKVKPTPNHIVGSIIIVLGLCVTTSFKVQGFCNTGTVYMLASCLCSAVYTILADYYTKEDDPLLLSILQMVFTTVFGWILWFLEEPATFGSVHYTRNLLSSIFVLAFFAKAYAYIALMFAQKYTNAFQVTVIASTEPILTLMLAVLLPAAYGGQESLHIASVCGVIMIAIGAFVAGLKFLSKKG